ncbi:universal stress protein [Pedobacter sp. B4-66]|uniref:universal stress protein n=1 Tax=Pedobacter sp. B4-66 TaxID=2817280 RepID=UPI001BDB6077|nr:universal stress protein [Pedobacter sp. B4-66]
MKTIIIATDFSASALNAARYAASLSKQLSVKQIILYHSYELPIATEIPFPEYQDSHILHEKSTNSLINLKLAIADSCSEDAIITILTNDTPTATGLDLLGKQYPESLVVIGVTGKSRGLTALIGSNTISIVKHSRTPVLVVPNESSYKIIKNVVLSCDLKDVTQCSPVLTIKEFVHSLNAKLLLLNVDHNESQHFNPDIITEQYHLHALWDNEAPEYHYTDNKDVAFGIMEFAKEHQSGIVIIIAKTYGFFEGLFHKSITRKLALNTQLPLLILKEAQN